MNTFVLIVKAYTMTCKYEQSAAALCFVLGPTHILAGRDIHETCLKSERYFWKHGDYPSKDSA